MRPTLPLLACAAVALALAATASAKAPPTGAYECVIGSASYLFGTIKVLDGSHYTKDGTKGTFTTGGAATRFKDGITGYTIRFKGGSLNGYKGRWYKSKGGGVTHEIALENPKDGFESIYCDRHA